MSLDVLIVDDEPQVLNLLTYALETREIEVRGVDDSALALELLKEHNPEIVITDIMMPGMDGLELLRRIKTIRPQCEVIVMTAFARVETTREALKCGAVDYITKPFSIETDLMPLIQSILATPYEEDERKEDSFEAIAEVTRAADETDAYAGIIGRGRAMQVLLEKVAKVARSDASVLLRGESGTGKELIAGALHQLSSRKDGPFIKVNCAALPETLLESTLFGYVKGAFTGAASDTQGLFQAADGGTLFLDEIGEVSPAFQPKLLRVLQNGEIQRVGEALRDVKVDVRVIAATNLNLEKAMSRGTFREDLYYRLNVVPLVVPSMVERREDIPELITHFTRKFAGERDVQFSPDVEWALSEYEWPGNVRELANAIQHAIVLSGGSRIEMSDLPAAIQDQNRLRMGEELPSRDDPLSLESIEIRCILQALSKTGGNRTRAAALLGLTRRALCYRIQKYGLHETDIARPTVKAVRPNPPAAARKIS